MTLTGEQIEQEGLADWRLLLRSLHARFRTGDFAAGLRLVDAIGAAAEELNHHPDLDLRYSHVDVRLTSHDSGGVTERDVRLARRISALASAQSATAEPTAVSVLELALDTPEHSTVLPFWAAVLGYEADGDEVRDSTGRGTTLWFQPTDSADPARQRFHLDVIVPPEVVAPRIDAALQAGGSLVSDAEAPSFWVLSDPDGNKACLCTWQGGGS
ncbi:MAG TPA: 4a-hydroxytetrahydrobiopterin dehydratase [Nocardioides sp.]|uniref:4a-hydroxytetrahydrobiopterin dehydratase n=1 Tax=Nocardioides sp. TaxID=35761 RepID=UPI002CFA03E8|nr:4a-hydroxytetrahydrobiopterin dehydratase [Nocardioides sp.]HQR27984.1 4a-hydroxytetrahydrobiopterin dehydratase [Nocardioides sp.]